MISKKHFDIFKYFLLFLCLSEVKCVKNSSMISDYDPDNYEHTTRTELLIEPKPEVIIKPKAPEVKITQGEKVEVYINESIKLTCEVSAYPAPKIVWTDADGTVLTSKISEVELPYKYISELNVWKVNRSLLFYCNASNDVNDTVSKKIKVNLSWFRAIIQPPVNTRAEYGKKKHLSCDVQSPIPGEMKWHVPNNLKPSDYRISRNKKILTIKSMSYAAQGWYECTTVYKTISYTTSTNLSISDLAPPSINITSSKSTVLYGETINILCNITGGVPPPRVSWKVMRKGESVLKNMSGSGQKLMVDNATFANAGQYQCHANNKEGHVNSTIDITVQKAPEASIDEGIEVEVLYGSANIFKCRVVAYPPPTIVWRDNEGQELDSEDTSSDYEKVSKLNVTNMKTSNTYSCHANNSLNETVTSIQVLVKHPIEFHTHPEITSVKYNQAAKIICDAKSEFSMKMKWFYQKNEHSNISEIHTSANYLISSDNRTLEIISTNFDLIGNYTCEASLVDDELKNKSFTTIVEINDLSKPQITNDRSAYFGVTGDLALNISCNVTGVPKPNITWTHEGKVVYSDKKILVSNNTLLVMNPIEKDSSNFTCVAENVYGSATRTFDIIVSDYINYDEDLIKNSTVSYLKQGQSINIQCLLPHSDPKSIRWYVNGVNASVNGSFYSLKNATYSNDGNYTCRLNTEQGSESQNYVVDVGYEPIFSETLPRTFNWIGDKLDRLSCVANAKPSAEIEWFYNGNKLLGKHNSELNIFNWGAYTCNASNVHGSAQFTINVTSEDCIINRTAESVQNTPLIIEDESWPKFEKYEEMYTISQNKTITLECSTQDQSNNTFKTHPNDTKIKAECYNEDKFTVDGKTYKFKDLQCQNYVRPSHLFTKKPCMLNGEIIKVGFKLDNGFLGVYNVCYSEAYNKTLSTKVVLSEANIGNLVGPSFMLNEGIKAGKQVSEIIKCQYNQRWLVNPNDVAFGPAQIATLSDKYNAVPVYEPCEGSSRVSWSNIENHVSKIMDTTSTMTVWTGASQYNSKAIPRYLWKVMQFEDMSLRTIVYVNDPKPDNSDILCSNITQEYKTKDQYTYSCPMDQFYKTFKVPMIEFS